MKLGFKISSLSLLLLFLLTLVASNVPHTHHEHDDFHEIAEAIVVEHNHDHGHSHDDNETSPLHSILDFINDITDSHSHEFAQHNEPQIALLESQLNIPFFVGFIIATINNDICDDEVSTSPSQDYPRHYSGVFIASHSLRGPPSLI